MDPGRGRTIPTTQRHQRHDELVSELGVWYTRSVPEMGFYVQQRRFGFYQRQKDTGRVRVTVRHLPAEDVPRFLEDLREYSGEEEITFHVDDRELDWRIGPVLLDSGCTPDVAEVFLAHTGGMPVLASEPEDLSVEAVNEDTIEEYVRTERKGFADSEAEPDAEEIRRRLTLCRAEMGGQGRFLLARVAGEPASVVGFYEGEDRFVHDLATRVPFRRRGIGSRLLWEILAGVHERGCRSTIISAAKKGRPVGLYRSLGFTDEVYWRREYKHVPSTARAVGREGIHVREKHLLQESGPRGRRSFWTLGYSAFGTGASTAKRQSPAGRAPCGLPRRVAQSSTQQRGDLQPSRSHPRRGHSRRRLAAGAPPLRRCPLKRTS